MSPYTTTPPSLYAIVSFDQFTDFQELSEKLLEAKIEWIQLRNKNTLAEAEFIEFGKSLLLKRDNLSPKSKIIINDDPVIAMEIGADGVHVGQGDMSPEMARKIMGPKAIVGLSTNKVSQVKAAPVEVLSYLACGPIFHSASKSGHADPIGIAGVSEITSITDFPFVAIGGINLSNAEDVFKAGAKSIAVIGEIIKHKDDLNYFKSSIDTYSKQN